MKLGVLLSVLVCASACGKGAEDILDTAESFKTKICACPDAACATKLDDELEAFFAKNRESMKDMKLTKEQETRSLKLSKEIRDCIEKLEKSST